MNPLKRAERWFRHDFRRAVSRLLETPAGRKALARYLPRYVTHVTIDCGDHRMTVSPHELVGRRLIRHGHFERDRVARVLEILRERGLHRPGGVALEIGANIGTQTVYLCLDGRFRRLLAIEPAPDNLALLELNVRQNGLSDVVTIMPHAAGDREDELDMHLDAENHGANSLAGTRGSGRSMKVRVRPVDAMIRDAGIDPAEITLIWMDIEGFEPVACRSMEALLERRVPMITEFQSSFMGEDASRAFVSYLARFYPRCIVFPEKGAETAMAVSEIPIVPEILDVLLLPA